MQYLVNSNEMKTYDANTIETFQVPSLVLMERAALEIAAVIREEGIDAGRTLIVCGCGNNGGDGLALARLLFLQGKEVTVVLAGEVEKATEETARQLAILKAYGIPWRADLPEEDDATLVVDALFGIGLSRKIEGKYSDFLQKMNQKSGVKLAVDIPSGINATDGTQMGTCFCADITVTFAYGKIGMYLWPGADACGRIFVRKMGIEEKSFLGKKPAVAAYTIEDLCRVPKRRSRTNKGSYGKVLLIAGSVNMAGAAILAAKAAYAAGCGLVKVYTAEENRVILQTAVPEAILVTYTGKEAELPKLEDAMEWADVIACGPGIGTGAFAEHIVKDVLEQAKDVPLVLDADALNIISKNLNLLQNTKTNVIITPHLGEMSRLCKKDIPSLQGTLLETASEFAENYNVVCVLKDARTVTKIPGGQSFLNLSGNNGMATAGSGDVLTGILSSLLAQGMCAADAALLGVFLHGLAGDEICKETGAYGMMAEDIIRGLKIVLRKAERNEYE